MTFSLKPLSCDPARIKGMSERLIVSHYENKSGGAVKRLNLIEVSSPASTMNEKTVHLDIRSGHMKWITRERVKVDRVACPWLIKKFVDKDAEFFFVPADKVSDEAKRLNAISYDVKGVELGHHGKECSFEAILKKYKLTADPALVLLGKIVNGADTDNTLYQQPEGPGVEAVAEGFRHLGFKDDHAQNAAEWIVYDALYAYCREMVWQGKPNGDFAH